MDLDHRAKFAGLCDEVGVPVPEHGVVTSRAEAEALPAGDRIFKRIESTVNREIEVLPVKAGEKLPDFKPTSEDPWQYQRLLSGQEYSAWYVCDNGRVTFAACYPSQADLL